MRFQLYLPPGDHPPHSLGCVFVAPAGSTLLTGIDVDSASGYHDETLPYAENGFAVVHYSLDGAVSEFADEDEGQVAGYGSFKAAGAGVLNTARAVDLALARLPEVDPNRLYVAGHSSAGTLALLAAVHDPRIKACVAYAPATDLEERLSIVNNAFAGQAFPGISQFLYETSPARHVQKLKIPTFVFHARDDSNEPFETTERFVREVQAVGGNVAFSPTDSGDHYDSMIREGIPRGIAWLRSLPGEQ